MLLQNWIPMLIALQLALFSIVLKGAEINSPLLAVVLMVKDEESVIEETLKPFVEGGIKHFFIYDTGSTDKTREKAQAYFQQHAIQEAFIEQEPFIDFATSRNRALDLAEQKFPTAVFMLMPDAEWYMNNVKGLLDFCKQQASEQCTNYNCSAYLIKNTHPNLDNSLVRLFRRDKHIRFVGVVHEYANIITTQKVPEDIYFEIRYGPQGMRKQYQRWLRDKELLFQEFKNNPMDTRTIFYLAQTLHCLSDLENAYKYYQLRLNLSHIGWYEENFMAAYRLAQVTEILAQTNKAYTWAMALEYYEQAYAINPNRAEPLIRIAQHYLSQNKIHLACIFIQKAVQIEYPKDNLLFIDKILYEQERWKILKHCPSN